MSTLVSAAWTVLDRVHSGSPSALRKGPRGGGRDRDAIAQHVFTAEAAYARKLGISRPKPRFQNRAAIERLRLAILAALGARTPDAFSTAGRSATLRGASRGTPSIMPGRWRTAVGRIAVDHYGQGQ